jgi:hypothetical protein
MKISLLFTLLALVVSAAWAGPKDEVKADTRAKVDARNAAAELFKTATPAEAVAQLQSRRPAEDISDGRLASTLQGLVETASTLYNKRDFRAAHAAVNEALSLAAPVLDGRTTMPAVRRAQLCSALGFLCENILRDPKLAGDLYLLATKVNPSDKQAARQRDELAAIEKQRGRK